MLSEFFGRADRRIRAFVSIEKPRSGLEIAKKAGTSVDSIKT